MHSPFFLTASHCAGTTLVDTPRSDMIPRRASVSVRKSDWEALYTNEIGLTSREAAPQVARRTGGYPVKPNESMTILQPSSAHQDKKEEGEQKVIPMSRICLCYDAFESIPFHVALWNDQAARLKFLKEFYTKHPKAGVIVKGKNAPNTQRLTFWLGAITGLDSLSPSSAILTPALTSRLPSSIVDNPSSRRAPTVVEKLVHKRKSVSDKSSISVLKKLRVA
jgi:hypothetical protein